MARTNSDLTQYQWGLESFAAKGTAVPATSKMAVPMINFSEAGEVYRPQLAKGLVIRNRGEETVLFRHTEFEIPDVPVSLEHLVNFLAMAIVGQVTPTGGPAPYTWVFTRDITAKNLPDTFTIERRLSDGAAFIDNEWAYCFLTSIEISGEQNAPLLLTANGVARRIQTSTFTAALAMDEPTILAFQQVEIWIDDTWATLGTSKISGNVVGFTFAFNTGFVPLWTAEGRTDKDFIADEINSDEVQISAQIRLLVESGASDFAAEKAAAVAQTLRAVRIKATSGTYSIQIDFLAKHNLPDIQTVEAENGLNVVELDMVEATDDTNLLRITVVNDVATLG